MHPPWNYLHFLLFFLVIVTSWTSGNTSLEEKDDGKLNSTRIQREVIERERRLIPYMTYYITQNLANSNSARQNIFVPITVPRQNILHFETVPQAVNNLQNVNTQQHDGAKSYVNIQQPAFIATPEVRAPEQRLQFKPKGEENRVLGKFYRLEPTSLQPRVPVRIQPQTIQPQQIIKVNPLSVEQKYVAPQIYKIIPVVAKIASVEQSPKSFPSSQPQNTYLSTKLQTLIPNAYRVNGQNYYSLPITPNYGNSYQGNKIVVTSGPVQQTPSLDVTKTETNLRPEKNTYTLNKIYSTPSTYTAEVDINDNRQSVNFGGNVEPTEKYRLNPIIVQNPIPITGIYNLTTDSHSTPAPSQPQVYYTNKINDDQIEHINSQNGQDFGKTQNVKKLPRLRVPQEEEIKFVASVTPITISNELGNLPLTPKYEQQVVANIYKQPSLNNFLSILKEADKLPHNLTPDNIDNGIKTLALILERLQQEKNYQDVSKILSPTVSSTSKPSTVNIKQESNDHKKVQNFPQPSGTSTPGRPGVDYPIYSSIPHTTFDCSTQRYKGFFGDPDTKCQVWHYCDLNGGQASFLCPNGTIFSQVALTCDWWFNVKCASTSQLYVLNERLYKYILPFSPSFPEDYSGPIVDTYLTAKFKEMEAKSRLKALKSQTTTTKPETSSNAITDSSTEALKEYGTKVYP